MVLYIMARKRFVVFSKIFAIILPSYKDSNLVRLLQRRQVLELMPRSLRLRHPKFPFLSKFRSGTSD